MDHSLQVQCRDSVCGTPLIDTMRLRDAEHFTQSVGCDTQNTHHLFYCQHRCGEAGVMASVDDLPLLVSLDVLGGKGRAEMEGRCFFCYDHDNNSKEYR